MVITASDLLLVGLTLFVAVLSYGRLANLLRFLLPTRVRHRELEGEPAPLGPVPEALEVRGFRYLGTRHEATFRLHGRAAAVYAHSDGRVLDLPLSGRLSGAYVMTVYEGGRCAFTRAGTGRDLIRDRYRSRAIGAGKTLRDLLEAHAESESAVSLGERAVVVETLSERLDLARRWYGEHGRTELLIPAVLDGSLLAAFVALSIYLWVSGPG